MIKLSKLKQDATPYYLIVDLVMVALVMINLGWIIFDWVYAVPWVQSLLEWVYPPFVAFYGEQVHPNFYNYDLIFVSIFISEFFLGWGLSIYKKLYARWWHYPFMHWYDLLGCIPVGSFRFLRVLRLVSILVRLQRLGVIDLRNTALFQFLGRYYNIFVEEVSDRVVVNVLEGVQEELKQGGPLQEQVVREVLQPRQGVLAEEIVARVEQSTQQLLSRHQHTVRNYVHGVIAEAMARNPELKLVSHVPLFGGLVNRQLDHAVGDIVANVVEQLVADLSSEHFGGLVANYVETVLEHSVELPGKTDLDAMELLNDVLELVKAQVQVQRWRTEG